MTKKKDVAEALNTYFTEIDENLPNNLRQSNKQFVVYIPPIKEHIKFDATLTT